MTVATIRPAAAGDIAAITRIYADAVLRGTATFEIEPPDQAEMTCRMHALADGCYPYLVAEENGALAGYAYAGPYQARPAYRWTVEDTIYVDPGFHRRGIGSLLLAQLVIAAEARGFRQMVAVIGDSAQRRLDRGPRTAGFALIGTHALGRLQARQMAGHRADATRPRHRRYGAALS